MLLRLLGDRPELIFGEQHLHIILAEYARHYDGQRPHRALQLQPPRRDYPIADVTTLPQRPQQHPHFQRQPTPRRLLGFRSGPASAGVTRIVDEDRERLAHGDR